MQKPLQRRGFCEGEDYLRFFAVFFFAAFLTVFLADFFAARFFGAAFLAVLRAVFFFAAIGMIENYNDLYCRPILENFSRRNFFVDALYVLLRVQIFFVN